MERGKFREYPFHPSARDFCKVDFKELFSKTIYRMDMEEAVQNIIRSLKGEEIFRNPDPARRVRTFVITKIILAALNDRIITAKYANQERDLLEKSLLEEERMYVEEVAEILGLNVLSYSAGEFKIHFADFLKYSPRISGEKYSLFEQEIDRGFVFVKKDMLAKIMREAFVEKFKEDVDKISDMLTEEIIHSLIPYMEKILEVKSEFISQQDLGEVDLDALPPCIKNMLKTLQSGGNLTHFARFTLTAFLHTIGMSNDEILNLFSVSPDFNEKIAKYQVKHITGEISSKEYIPPKCLTLKSQGLCVNRDKLCEKINHPLIYYKIKKRGKKFGRKDKSVR